jgi:hypothetical protein
MTTAQPKANKTDASNGSKAICRFCCVLRSLSPDPRRSPMKITPMKIKTIATLIVATVSMIIYGYAKEPKQVSEPPAIIPEKPPIPSENLKHTRTKLLGKWTISVEATKAVPVDTVKYPWIPKKLDQLIKEGLSWEFREDGTVIETFGTRSESEGYRVFQDETGDVWIAMTRNDNWNLNRAKFADGQLHLTSIARDHNDEEAPVIGTLVLSKSQ